MFFTLSKILGYLTSPLVWVCGLLVASLIVKSKRWKTRLQYSSIVILLFFSNDFIANEVMRLWEVSPTPYSKIDKVYSYGILLTGVTSTDNQPEDRVYFQRGADRVVHTVDLYKRGIIKKILVAGGSGRLLTTGRREADDIVKALSLMGVPREDILIENESRNTTESAHNVKAMLAGPDSVNLLLITSAFHMRRSEGCFRKAGMTPDTFSTDFYTHPRYFTPDVLLVPKIEALKIWQKLFREWTGIIAYRLAGYI
ncbi:MAG: YdcF family protein [Cyclobacteriaceae bacterium]|nr:YdcF family protein [Cyclobacteriaceae bacterium]